MKVGDKVRIAGRPEYGTGKIIRFYSNHSTVLVNFSSDKGLTYCDYYSLVKNEKQRDSVGA